MEQQIVPPAPSEVKILRLILEPEPIRHYVHNPWTVIGPGHDRQWSEVPVAEVPKSSSLLDRVGYSVQSALSYISRAVLSMRSSSMLVSAGCEIGPELEAHTMRCRLAKSWCTFDHFDYYHY